MFFMARRILSAVLALVLLLAVPAAAENVAAFSDVPAGDWSASVIEKSVRYGLIEGIGDGKFGYGQYMTRGSFAVVICRIFGWTPVSPATPSFSDCQSGQWYYAAVETLLAHGAVDGGLYFRPGDDISRQDMVVMLLRAMGYAPLAAAREKDSIPFADVTANRGYIALAYAFGIVGGVQQADGSYLFLPTHSTTRQETAAMLVRFYEKFTGKLSWLHGFYAVSSYSQIAYAASMNAVSLGWARLSVDSAGNPWLNQAAAGGNEWAIPAQASLATLKLDSAGVPRSLSVYASTSDAYTGAGGAASNVLAAALSSAPARKAAAAAIAAAAGDYAGVTIDFEGLRSAMKDSFTAFMTELRAALPAGKTLCVCVQPPEWYDGYDFRALGELCDKVILMAHDYQDLSLPSGWVGTGQTYNPPAPLDKIYAALSAVTDSKTGVADRSKIALAVSFATVALQVDANDRLASTTLAFPSYSTLLTRLRQSGTVMGWDSAAATPYAYYATENGSRYRVWYENERSVTEKIKLARMFGISGLSLWRLGSIPDAGDQGLSLNVWNAVKAQQ